MKALILAAGFGTRLLPHTRILPKPLFTINNRPVLDMAVDRLLDCGCEEIFINTHHLWDQIHDFIQSHPRGHCLKAVHEPEILDTGGAMANLKNDLADDDFLVVNADIVCDFDLKSLAAAHRSSDALATLLVHDCPRFNKLAFEPDSGSRKSNLGKILHFEAPPETGLAFTGIQALSPEIFDHMPGENAFSSIALYKTLCATGSIRALKAEKLFWEDMGTPGAYMETSRLFLAGQILGLPPARFNEIKIEPIAGDGSDRKWFRASHCAETLVICDHGICLEDSREPGSPLSTQPGRLSQLRSYTSIGRHLNGKGICVPRILGHDTISGQVALADLGSTHLADLADPGQREKTTTLYRQVIDSLVRFSQEGLREFDPAWTCQTRSYSKDLILEMECRYFMDAFVKHYLEHPAPWEEFKPVFSHIADRALAHGYAGLMHRDFQSRNIMIHQGDVWFIDFQSARKGPIQYDLASLLIDPYVKLPPDMQEELLDHAMARLDLADPAEKNRFKESYSYCCITRNLQMLGAFGFLTRIKKKQKFEAYIPHALAALKQRLNKMENSILAPLAGFINGL
ncbi:MAG: phosphotransferase [Desulfobacter sp.]|nr:MAG: phosphotransferase [Desulfobacter sp.]